jgi:hypothetical protein
MMNPMIEHNMNPVDFLLTELLHDGFFSLRKLEDPLLSTVVDTLIQGCDTTDYVPSSYYPQNKLISEDQMVGKMFNVTKKRIQPQYIMRTNVQIPKNKTPAGQNSTLLWTPSSSTTLISLTGYDDIFVAPQPTTGVKDIYIVCDSISDVIGRLFNGTSCPEHFRVHIMISSATISDPGSAGTLGSTESFQKPVDNPNFKKFVHTFKTAINFNGCNSFSILNFATGYINNLTPLPVAKAQYPNMNSGKTIIWNNKDKNKLFDYPDDTNLSFSPASHANKNAVKHLMNTATRCNVVVKPTNCISTHKWNQNSSHVSTTTKEHAIRAAQTKRIGDHHQIAFCEWLIQPNNFSNSGQEIFTPINMAGTPAGGFIRKEYNTSRGATKEGYFFDHNPSPTTPLNFQNPTAENTWFFTGDWPAMCFASYMGVNALFKGNSGIFTSKVA